MRGSRCHDLLHRVPHLVEQRDELRGGLLVLGRPAMHPRAR